MKKCNWQEEAVKEYSFWERWVLTRGLQWPDDYAFRMDPDSKFQTEWLPYFSCLPEEAKILDVGAGPATFLGKKYNGKKMNITAIDGLGDLYATLPWPDNCPVLTTIQCFSEEITDKFGENIFDFVIAKNTLDHSIDPLLCIREMIRAATPNGAIALLHRKNEGQINSYEGLHQWNFFIKNRTIFLGNKIETINISKEFKNITTIMALSDDNDSYCRIVLKKL